MYLTYDIRYSMSVVHHRLIDCVTERNGSKEKSEIFYRPVTIIRLLSKGTIEEGMYEIAQEKLHLEQQITGNEGKSTEPVEFR